MPFDPKALNLGCPSKRGAHCTLSIGSTNVTYGLAFIALM